MSDERQHKYATAVYMDGCSQQKTGLEFLQALDRLKSCILILGKTPKEAQTPLRDLAFRCLDIGIVCK